jgi:hypothetical protein
VSPAGVPDLSLTIGGVPVSATSPHREVALDSAPLEVRVAAPGYKSVALAVVPDRDRSLVVTLAPLPVPAPSVAPPKSAATRQPTPASSGVIRRYPF